MSLLFAHEGIFLRLGLFVYYALLFFYFTHGARKWYNTLAWFRVFSLSLKSLDPSWLVASIAVARFIPR